MNVMYRASKSRRDAISRQLLKHSSYWVPTDNMPVINTISPKVKLLSLPFWQQIRRLG
jgi:hypothetical protein